MIFMEVLDKILAWAKGIIIDWRIGTVGFVGFTAGLMITKNANLIVGIAVSVSMIIVDTFDKNYKHWKESYHNRKLQRILKDPKHQQTFFKNCTDEELKILTKLYRAYPDGYPLPSENIAVYQLKSQMAIIRVGNFGAQDRDKYGNLRTMFSYALQPWVKDWLDHNKKTLKKNV